MGRWLEWLLGAILIIQLTRFAWALVTPVGLFGDWRARQPVIVGADARKALFAGFDPFFRMGGEAPVGAVQQVTSLALQLFGTRVNEGSGLGSAIIAGSDGVQTSYAVGDEVTPGVKLKAVAFDHVVIDRGGTEERLFIDQSQGDGTPAGAPAGPPGAAADGAAGEAPPPITSGVAVPPPAVGGALKAQDLAAGANFAPRSEGGKVTGIVVNQQGQSAAFARAGLRPGDVITQVNGRAITSAGDIRALQSQVVPGARLSLMVERGSATVPVAVILEGGR
jgi:general secretion pathway protein C